MERFAMRYTTGRTVVTGADDYVVPNQHCSDLAGQAFAVGGHGFTHIAEVIIPSHFTLQNL